LPTNFEAPARLQLVKRHPSKGKTSVFLLSRPVSKNKTSPAAKKMQKKKIPEAAAGRAQTSEKYQEIGIY
jgi:hypothetical protein